jgi:hypothetical protein
MKTNFEKLADFLSQLQDSSFSVSDLKTVDEAMDWKPILEKELRVTPILADEDVYDRTATLAAISRQKMGSMASLRPKAKSVEAKMRALAIGEFSAWISTCGSCGESAWLTNASAPKCPSCGTEAKAQVMKGTRLRWDEKNFGFEVSKK